jgi:hypothetical protein
VTGSSSDRKDKEKGNEPLYKREIKGSHIKQEVLERTKLPAFLTSFKNVMCIKTSVCPNITLVGNSVPILKHSHVQNNVSNKRIVGSS